MIVSDIYERVAELVPGLVAGMPLEDALEVILEELERLKEIEFKYEGLCK